MTEFSRFPQGTRIVQVVEIKTPEIPEVGYLWLRQEIEKMYDQKSGLRELSLEQIERMCNDYDYSHYRIKKENEPRPWEEVAVESLRTWIREMYNCDDFMETLNAKIEIDLSRAV